MINTRNTSQRKAAMILLLVLHLSIGLNMAVFYQTEYQLDSPLIPKSTVLVISRPYLFAALVAVPFSIVAMLCFFFSRYTWVILLCALTVLWQFYYLNYVGL